MRNGTIAAGLLVTLIAGFLAGRVTSSSGTAHDRDGGSAGRTVPLKTRVTERPPVERPSTPGARLKQEIRAQSADRIPQLVFRALETGDPILRRQLMSDLYSRMDPSNYREMMNQILEISNATAREYPDEYLLMSMRAGQIAGQTVMEDWKKEGLTTEAASKSFTGWAQVDPEAARRWLEANPDLDGSTRSKLFNALLTGAIINDPVSATRLYGSLQGEDREQALATFTNQIVQVAGKESGVQWLHELKASGGDDPYVRRAATSLFDRILWSGANRRNAASLARDLESLITTFPDDADWTTRGMGQIRDRKVTGGIELLDELARGPVFKGKEFSQRQWNSAVDFALQRDHAAVDRWLQENPDSPIHAQVQEMAEKKKAQAAAAKAPPPPN